MLKAISSTLWKHGEFMREYNSEEGGEPLEFGNRAPSMEAHRPT